MDQDDNPLGDLAWAQLSPFPEVGREFLGAIVAMKPGSPHPVVVGTGVVVAANGNRALIMTAAHVIDDAVRTVQNPRKSHVSTLAEFLPPREISAASTHLKVFVQTAAGDVDACRVAFVAWDLTADTAILAIETKPEMATLEHVRFERADPDVGDLIIVMGFTDYTTSFDDKTGHGQVTMRPICRLGWIDKVIPEGTIWVRVPCLEASMPTFSGMSGGPAFFCRPDGMTFSTFALLSSSAGASSDVTADDELINDMTKPGRSIFTLIRRKITKLNDQEELVGLNFTISGIAHNPEVDGHGFEDLFGWVDTTPDDGAS